MKPSPVKLWRRQEEVSSVIGKAGKILLWTVIRVAPKSFAKEAPYPVVIVQMDKAKKMVGQLVDWQHADLVIGRKVMAVLRRVYLEDRESVIMYTIKFKPI